MATDQRFVSQRFPRSSRYHPEWAIASASGGANSLWLTEWLAATLGLRSGMRVLDLGCGRAASSIFLRREFGVQVWATDLWFHASENIRRIRDAGVASLANELGRDVTIDEVLPVAERHLRDVLENADLKPRAIEKSPA